jgi:hypothetical protein
MLAQSGTSLSQRIFDENAAPTTSFAIKVCCDLEK